MNLRCTLCGQLVHAAAVCITNLSQRSCRIPSMIRCTEHR